MSGSVRDKVLHDELSLVPEGPAGTDTLEELFGLDKSKVDSIREDLEAGRPVHIEVQALRTQLIQAGFIPG